LDHYTGQRGGVAIVDDERSLVEVYRKIMETRGIPVCFVAYDGEDAVRRFEEQNPRPCVVLMDYRMPGLNGIQAMIRILTMDPETKFIFISADEGVRDDAIRAGAVRFLQKPASIREIMTAINDVGAC
jgi:two-component system chemotaxis response regulator CheY